MKKLFVMVIMFVMMLSFNAFGAEKENEYNKIDCYGWINDENVNMQDGQIYRMYVDEETEIWFWQENGTLTIREYREGIGRSRQIEVTYLENQKGDMILFATDEAGNECAQFVPAK